MKLRKLHIENYKMFKDFDISFVDDNDEALPIVVLAGVNGSGKTTLLECLSVQQDRYELSMKEEGNLNFGFEKDFSWFKYYDDIIYLKSGIDEISIVEDEFVKYWYNQVKFQNKRNDEITESLQKFISETLKGLDLNFTYGYIDEGDNIFFENDKKDRFRIDELSTGEQTLLSKILYLYMKNLKDKIILIDEPELSLHPLWQNKVLEIYENFAKQNNCQIIIATHSPHIIGSAKNEYLRILRKNEDGKVEVVKDLKAEGRDINSILFDVMEEAAYRPKDFDDKIDRLHIAIDDRKIEEATERLEELSYGENDEVVMEAQMLIDMFSRDAQ